ncbi:MAG: ketoacyl-ACP synthase III [Saprospiraceae bacterium]|jgi:3-oxoacyl-[acyl-carrier-protein] synthase-3|nr:ketoacyl-ACP synthase III [Saprospiraceae bacterium]MBL0024303.1 ketoacyl-ACP synthase III [Saprospiraceae bacterium]
MDRNAVIISTGSYVPERIIKNAYLSELLGENVDTWLEENMQIYERRWCSESESTADLATNACKIAIENSGIKSSEIDLLIIATDTPEFISPSTASVIQDRLDLSKAGSFDVNSACAGFVTALDIASKYIKSDPRYKYILVVGVYTMSKFLNLSDKKTMTLFADGAGAILLGCTEAGNGYLEGRLITRGEYNSWMGVYGGASKYPITKQRIDDHDHQLKFIQKIPKEINPVIWSDMIGEMCKNQNISPTDIDHFFFTQININSIFETMDKLNVDRSKAETIMHNYGYTGSACIPMAIDSRFKKGLVKKGDIICLMGSGAGLSFGSSLIKI